MLGRLVLLLAAIGGGGLKVLWKVETHGAQIAQIQIDQVAAVKETDRWRAEAADRSNAIQTTVRDLSATEARHAEATQALLLAMARTLGVLEGRSARVPAPTYQQRGDVATAAPTTDRAIGP